MSHNFYHTFRNYVGKKDFLRLCRWYLPITNLSTHSDLWTYSQSQKYQISPRRTPVSSGIIPSTFLGAKTAKILNLKLSFGNSVFKTIFLVDK